MKETKIKGIYKDRNQLFTINPSDCKNKKIYGEKIVKIKGKEFRSWNPYRSKLSALLLKNIDIKIKSDFDILYLGAATGTTVSHISDILVNGTIYAIESSAVSMKKLLELCKKRKNIVPILEDAFHSDKYQSIVPKVDFLYQDISQRNQSKIFNENIDRYLKKNRNAVIMVKARSIDISMKPDKVYEKVCSELKDSGLKIVNKIELLPFDKDHAAIIVKN
jgi:fibrillarin-like pre-rRNA processing protein